MLDSGGMQDALQRQADQIAMDVERSMGEVPDEAPPRVTDAPLEGAQHVDDETLAYVRLWCGRNPGSALGSWSSGAVSDLTLMTRLEDATGFAEEVLKVWPTNEDA
ncbi:MAG: hypothetical protein CM15mP128_5600 [Methanobacteriota archaeon]|nr:MAG: hypothetical protein CM15mP128_5600 [Euryarchaeota archaeon]